MRGINKRYFTRAFLWNDRRPRLTIIKSPYDNRNDSRSRAICIVNAGRLNFVGVQGLCNMQIFVFLRVKCSDTYFDISAGYACCLTGAALTIGTRVIGVWKADRNIVWLYCLQYRCMHTSDFILQMYKFSECVTNSEDSLLGRMIVPV